jgi:hypothetical protein
MAQIVTIDNFPQFNLMDVGELTADVVAGATVLPVSTEGSFDTDHAILLGIPGAETTEVVIPSAVADDSLTVAAIDNGHKKGTKVYKLRGNKARIYRGTKVSNACPTDEASYTAQGTPITLRGDSLQTEWNDPTGDDSLHCWLFTFYNDIPTTPEETSLDTIEATSGNLYAVTVDQVRSEAGFKGNPYISDADILEKIRLAQGEANSSAIVGGYILPVSNDMFTNAVLLLAAGYLMIKDYGLGSNGINKEGRDKLKDGKDLLKQIETGEKTLDGVETAGEPRRGVISGFEDDLDDLDDEPWFTNKDHF